MRPMLSSIGCKFLSCYPPKRSPCPKTGRVFCCVVWGGGRHCEPLGRSNPVGLVCWPRLADLIDAPWDGSGNVAGDGASGGYTAVVSYTYESGSSGTGATLKPNGGDTSKTLFLPNAGIRNGTSGAVQNYGLRGYSWSAEQRDTSQAWHLTFHSGNSGGILDAYKLHAKSLRCVRS